MPLFPHAEAPSACRAKIAFHFWGKPLFVWTCEAAHQSGCFDRILVSTEDAEIAELARTHGFAVDNRPPELATDQAGTTDVCLELLERLERQGEHYDVVVLLYPTAPLRNAEDIRSMVRLISREDTDFVHAVTSFEGNPYQLLYQNAGGYLGACLATARAEKKPGTSHAASRQRQHLPCQNRRPETGRHVLWGPPQGLSDGQAAFSGYRYTRRFCHAHSLCINFGGEFSCVS